MPHPRDTHSRLLNFGEFAYVQEIGANVSTTIQTIAHTNNALWLAVAGLAQRIDLSTPTTDRRTRNIDIGAAFLTVKKAANYRVDFIMSGVWDLGNDWIQLVRSGEEVLTVAQFSARGVNTDGAPVALAWHGELVAGDTLDVRLDGFDGVDSDLQAYTLSVMELAPANALISG